MNVPARPRAVVTGAVAGFAVGIAALAMAPALFGWRTLTVMSGSMSPAIRTGDAVVVRPVPAAELRRGQVATFPDPEGSGRLVTHRVQAIRPAGGAFEVTTRGDANTGTESWRISADGSVGRVVLRLPYAGYALRPANTPAGRLALVAVPALLLGLMGVLSMWGVRPRRPAPPTADVAP